MKLIFCGRVISVGHLIPGNYTRGFSPFNLHRCFNLPSTRLDLFVFRLSPNSFFLSWLTFLSYRVLLLLNYIRLLFPPHLIFSVRLDLRLCFALAICPPKASTGLLRTPFKPWTLIRMTLHLKVKFKKRGFVRYFQCFPMSFLTDDKQT